MVLIYTDFDANFSQNTKLAQLLESAFTFNLQQPEQENEEHCVRNLGYQISVVLSAICMHAYPSWDSIHFCFAPLSPIILVQLRPLQIPAQNSCPNISRVKFEL